LVSARYSQDTGRFIRASDMAERTLSPLSARSAEIGPPNQNSWTGSARTSLDRFKLAVLAGSSSRADGLFDFICLAFSLRLLALYGRPCAGRPSIHRLDAYNI
jgi:hypothetical protein